MKTVGLFPGVMIGLLMGLASQAGHIEPPANREPAEPLGPQMLDPSQHGIGTPVADRRLDRLYGGHASLHAIRGNRGAVVLVRDPECPVSRVYGPRQAEMAREYQVKGFNFVVLYMNDQLDALSLARDAAAFAGPAVFIKHDAANLAGDLGVNSTGDVFVLDAQQRLRYRGAVDDQFGIGFTREFASRRFLRNALDALISDKRVVVPATSAPGCHIDADPGKDSPFQPWNPHERVS